MMKELIQFCIKPQSNKAKVVKFQQKLNITFKLLLLDIIISVITVFPASFILRTFEINRIPAFEIFDRSFFESILGWFLLVVFITPILEELSTRLFLNYSKLNVVISSIFNIGLLYFFFNTSKLYYWIIVVLCLMLMVVAVLLLRKSYHSTNKIQDYLSSHFNYVFYFSVILFSVYHALDYHFEGIVGGLLVIVLILPKIISGCILGFVRVRLGFIWGIALHVIINAVFFLVSLLTT